MMHVEPLVHLNQARSRLQAGYHHIPAGGGVIGKILVGVGRRDSETLSLYQTTSGRFFNPILD